MKHVNLRCQVVAHAAILLGVLAVGGCNLNAHPDDQPAVYSALSHNNLRSVTVSQNRQSGVITLTGIVADPDQKMKAANLAKEAAPEYAISNKIQIEATGVASVAMQVPTNTGGVAESQ
jgi:hypothetical protein